MGRLARGSNTMIEDKSFVFHYIPIKGAANKLDVSTDRLILECMKGTVSLYVVNQSNKLLEYVPLSHLQGWAQLKKLLRYGHKSLHITKGEMIKLQFIADLDHLAKGILTEDKPLMLHPDGDYYLSNSVNPLFRYFHANYLINKFHPITLDHVFMLRSELKTLKAELEAPKQLDDDEPAPTESGAQTRQEQRELIFFEWLKGQEDEHKVSLMKKEDVLVELRKIDPHLFMGEQKHFFRLQKRIVFKSGRKAENGD
jgi:hypothetical protein